VIEPTTVLEREAALRGDGPQREHERRRVAEHYEHRPEIFELVLDRRLAYATGIFKGPSDDLESAQANKYAFVERALAIQPGESVLDIGCGWGSNLLYLAEHTQGVFRGITLSARQRQVALERAGVAGVADRVQVDVRHVEDLELEPESLDAVLFVGSIVHMHHREEIHRRVGAALRPGGRLLISDCFFPNEVRGDRDSAAAQYIFVEALGYCRLLRLSEELALVEAAGLDVTTVENLTDSYVTTLGCWIDNVRRHRERIDNLSPGFSKLLQTYMTIAKLSFLRRSALEYMIVARKPLRSSSRRR
jgi:cyclopropane-fatty-acyl-phospholipid synthase